MTENTPVETKSSIWSFFDKPSSWYVELAAYLILGFIVGFLVKHAGRLFFMLLIGAALAIWVLDTYQIITIHWTVLQNVFGITTKSMPELLTMTTSWVKTHIIEALVGLFGFVLAWKFA